MSDFCYDCTEKQGNPGNENDFVGFPGWQLCEGCGAYVFVNEEGKRVDETPTAFSGGIEHIERMGTEIPFDYYALPWYQRGKIWLSMRWWWIKNAAMDVFG